MTSRRAWFLVTGVALLGCGGDAAPQNPVAEQVLSKVRVTPTSGLATDESGTTASFIVELTAEPSEKVSIRLFSSDESEGTPDVSELVFTREDWGQRVVTVTGRHDDEVDGNQRYQIVLDETVSNDVRFQSVPVADVTLTNIDDDAPGVTVLHEAFTTWENGESGSLRVRLNSRPVAPVSLRLTTRSEEARLGPADLVFLPRDWNVEQTVELEGADDLIQDGDMAYQIEVQDVNSADFEYLGLHVAPVDFVNIDDDRAGIEVEFTGDQTLYEGGEGVDMSFRLTSQPIDDVTLRCRTDRPERVALSAPVLRFTAEDWSELHHLQISAIDNLIIDEYGMQVTLTCDPAESEGADYDGLVAADTPVEMWIYNDDYADVVVEAGGRDTCEDGGVDCCVDVSIALTSTARGDVELTLESDDVTEGVPSVPSVVLREGGQPTTVQVCGVDDDLIDGYVSYTVTVSIAASDDPDYTVGPVSTLYLTNVDNDW